MPRRALVLGATSAIAQETARLLARDGDALFLVGRDAAKLGAVAEDLRMRGASRVETLVADLNDCSGHDAILEQAHSALGGLDLALLAQGVLGEQKQAQASWSETERLLTANFLAPASLLTRLAERFERQRGGTIAAIGSVAGDRGRQSNYVYGAAKGALAIFLQGLRNRLHRAGVRVVTIKPGFVDTPMTAHLDQGLLFVKPATVARGIYRALAGHADVVYLPFFWRAIMFVIRAIPEPLFKRLGL